MDKLRCNGSWQEVAELASTQQPSPSATLASVEARVNLTEHTAHAVTQLLQKIPTGLGPEDSYIASCLEAHIHVLSGDYRSALEALKATVQAPPSTSGYLGTCLIKSRALMTRAYLETDQIAEAIEAGQSLDITSRTLETNKEAAIWASRLYASLYECEPSQDIRKSYERVLAISKVSGDRVPELDATRAAANGKADGNNEVNGSGANGVNGTHKSSPNGANGTKGGAGGAHHATPLQQNRDAQLQREQDCQTQAASWRSKVTFQQPLHLLVLSKDRQLTESVRGNLEIALKDTFTSPVVMRLYTEVLVSLGKYTEAFAAFRTYTAYQKLQILKKESGAHASPDNEADSVWLYGLMLSLTVELPQSDKAGAIKQFVHDLADTMPKNDKAAVAASHGVLARAYEWQARNAVGNVYFEDRFKHAQKHFEQCKWDMDAATAHAWALHLLATKGPSEVFPVVKDAVAKFADYLPLWHVLIVLLSADQQFELAEELAKQVLGSPSLDFGLLGMVSKLYLLEIKKTLVAILEVRHGISGALEQLHSTLELVNQMYETDLSLKQSHSPTSPSTKHHHHLPHPHLRRREKTLDRSSARSNGQTYRVVATTQSQHQTPDPHYIVDIWLWAAQMYTRANLETEALAAISEAEEHGKNASTLAARAHILALSQPKEAWATYSEALALEYDNMSAVIGRASLLEVHAEVLFPNETDRLEATRSNMSALENLVNHCPGRNTSEAWYLYGATLESTGDITGAKDAFWKSIALEEKNGVRAYVPYFEYHR